MTRQLTSSTPVLAGYTTLGKLLIPTCFNANSLVTVWSRQTGYLYFLWSDYYNRADCGMLASVCCQLFPLSPPATPDSQAHARIPTQMVIVSLLTVQMSLWCILMMTSVYRKHNYFLAIEYLINVSDTI